MQHKYSSMIMMIGYFLMMHWPEYICFLNQDKFSWKILKTHNFSIHQIEEDKQHFLKIEFFKILHDALQANKLFFSTKCPFIMKPILRICMKTIGGKRGKVEENWEIFPVVSDSTKYPQQSLVSSVLLYHYFPAKTCPTWRVKRIKLDETCGRCLR